MEEFRPLTPREWLILAGTPFVLVALFVIPLAWFPPEVAVVPVMTAFGVGAIAWSRWRLRRLGHRCTACGHQFSTSFLEFFFSVEALYHTRLQCPECRKVTWTVPVARIGERPRYRGPSAAYFLKGGSERIGK